MLDFFKDPEEIHKIIVFITGDNMKDIASRINYSREHYTILLKTKDEEKRKALAKLQKEYYKTEISQFVSRYSNLQSSPFNSTVREPGPEASLEELLKAKREFVHAAEATEQRIYDLLARGSGNSLNGTPSGPVQKDNGPKKGKRGKPRLE